MATILKGIRKGKGGKLSGTGDSMTYVESHEYVVISDIKNEAPLVVLSTTGLPRVALDAITGTGGQCVCTSVDPKQDTVSPNVWNVAVEFSTDTKKQDTGSNPNPTTWVPIYSGKIETYPEVMYEDFSATPKKYVNSANKKFPEPLIRNRPIIVYSFKQYIVATITDPQIGEFNDTINSAVFRGFAVDTLKCTIADFERGFYYGFPCTVLSVQVAYKRNAWLDRPLDMGFEFRVTPGAETVATAGGKLVSLNTDGTLRSDTSEPLAKEFVPHKRVAFATFLR